MTEYEKQQIRDKEFQDKIDRFNFKCAEILTSIAVSMIASIVTYRLLIKW